MRKINSLKYVANIKSFFSFKGVYDRSSFGNTLVFGYLVFYLFSETQIPYWDILGWFGYFYIALNAYQKRCRDLSQKGSWIIAIVSLFFIYLAVLHPLGIDKTEFFLPISQTILMVYLCVFVYALLMPGKKENAPNLTSPLLKKPRIYFATCIIVFLISRWFFLHYDLIP